MRMHDEVRHFSEVHNSFPVNVCKYCRNRSRFWLCIPSNLNVPSTKRYINGLSIVQQTIFCRSW